MSDAELLRRLQAEYDIETGFVGLLRSGKFDEVALDRLIAILNELEPRGKAIDRRLVSLLWWIPWVIEWQGQRLERENRREEAARVHRAHDTVFKELERILGVA
jgi:hypothetical protein